VYRDGYRELVVRDALSDWWVRAKSEAEAGEGRRGWVVDYCW
jgi:hypothetical protein